jgi:hypothetical protein
MTILSRKLFLFASVKHAWEGFDLEPWNQPNYLLDTIRRKTYATVATPYIRNVILRTDKLSFKDRTTLPWTSVGAVSSSDGVMTITSFSFVPTLQHR